MNVSQQDTFLRWVVSTPPNLQAGGSPHVGCPRMLTQYFRSYPPYWRPFLHPPPEDAPCRDDSGPVNILATHLPGSGWTLSACVCQVFHCVCRLTRLFAALDLPPSVFQLSCPVLPLWCNKKYGCRASRYTVFCVPLLRHICLCHRTVSMSVSCTGCTFLYI